MLENLLLNLVAALMGFAILAIVGSDALLPLVQGHLITSTQKVTYAQSPRFFCFVVAWRMIVLAFVIGLFVLGLREALSNRILFAS